jgi:hypothetical protein
MNPAHDAFPSPARPGGRRTRRRMMINLMMAAALTTVVVIEVIGALILRGLERRCRQIERRRQIDGDLVRWYARGFKRPTELAGWLMCFSLTLAVAALVAHAHPLLGLLAFGLASIAYLELRFGHGRRRFHNSLARAPQAYGEGRQILR